MYLNVDGPVVYGAISVTTTPVELKVGGSTQEERKVIMIQSMDSSIYIGYDNSVSSSNGMELRKRQTVFLEVGDKITVYAVASAGSIDVRIAEFA